MSELSFSFEMFLNPKYEMMDNLILHVQQLQLIYKVIHNVIIVTVVINIVLEYDPCASEYCIVLRSFILNYYIYNVLLLHM